MRINSNKKNNERIFNFFRQFPINLRGEHCRWWFLFFAASTFFPSWTEHKKSSKWRTRRNHCQCAQKMRQKNLWEKWAQERGEQGRYNNKLIWHEQWNLRILSLPAMSSRKGFKIVTGWINDWISQRMMHEKIFSFSFLCWHCHIEQTLHHHHEQIKHRAHTHTHTEAQ